VIDAYLDHLDAVFALIASCEAGQSVEELLQGPVCHSGFRRLN
jgi:glutamate-1-semialdehyde 2,1-aminomutase